MSRKLKIDQIHIIPRVGGGEDMIIESDEGGGTLFEDIKITGYGFGGISGKAVEVVEISPVTVARCLPGELKWEGS